MTIMHSQLDLQDASGPFTPPDMPHPLAILNSAVQRGADVNTLERISALAREWKADAARQQYAEAMAAVQGEIPVVIADTENKQTNSRYAKRESIAKIIKPVYLKHGFTATFSEDGPPVDGMMHIVGVVRHIGGHVETFHRYAPSDSTGLKGNPNKTAVQGGQSTMSYISRRLECEIFGVTVADEDRDGNGAPAGFITPEMVKEVHEALEQSNSDIGGFLAFVGADSLAEMNHEQFRRGMTAIASKKRGKK